MDLERGQESGVEGEEGVAKIPIGLRNELRIGR